VANASFTLDHVSRAAATEAFAWENPGIGLDDEIAGGDIPPDGPNVEESVDGGGELQLTQVPQVPACGESGRAFTQKACAHG
jgi:hypothetical protein